MRSVPVRWLPVACVLATSCATRYIAPLEGKASVRIGDVAGEAGVHSYAYGRAVSSASGDGARKLGEGCAHSVLSLVAWGDASVGRFVTPARGASDAPRFTHADVEHFSLSLFLPVYARQCVIAYGK